jgi:hypothetical protein
MPKISESQALKLLESHGVPKGTMRGKRGSQINRSKHRQLAMAAAQKSVMMLDLAERWATGTPTKREMRAAVGSKLRMQFAIGPLAWLYWSLKIYSWVSVIWDAWNKEEQ